MTKDQKENYLNVCSEMVKRIFAGREEITFEQWMEFKNELSEMVWHYEFHQFDLDHHGHMSSLDFAQSLLVHYVPFHKIKEYKDHLMQFESYKLGCVSFKQYVAFQYFLKKRMDIINKVKEVKKLDVAQLKELVDDFERDSDYCIENRVHISDDMIESFLHALDIDDSGVLEEDEILGILSNKKTIGGQKQKGGKN